jgi:predicted dehydrogenase
LIEIVGTEGILFAHDFALSDRTIQLQVSLRVDGTSVDVQREEINVPNLYVEEITSFSSSILNNTEVAIPGVVGLRNQHVLDLAMVGGGVLSHS